MSKKADENPFLWNVTKISFFSMCVLGYGDAATTFTKIF